jgi:hypothetical protein
MAGTVVVSSVTPIIDDRGIMIGRKIAITATADASAATYPATDISALLSVLGVNPKNTFLYYAKVKPGATAPTDASSFTVKDADALDLLGGRGASAILAASTNSVNAGTPDTPMLMLIDSALTLAITGNSVNSAIVYVTLYAMFALTP